MKKLISNIVFTKNRPLQLDAYLESLYRYFPSELIQTYIIYKVELFDEQYMQLFRKYLACTVVRENDFHSDFLKILSQVNTKYILFGIDDVVFFDSVEFDVINQTFREHSEDIFGFTLRFSPESLKDSNDIITDITVAGQKISRLNWKNGQTPHSRYPFELCCTIYATSLVKKVVSNTMSNNLLIRKLFSPDSVLIKALGKVISRRSILKSFGYFFRPNTLESWNCRWCQNNSDLLPSFTYFQKLCASALQVNMVNISARKGFEGDPGYAVEALAEKYKRGFRIDIDFVSQNKPTGTHAGTECFKLTKSK